MAALLVTATPGLLFIGVAMATDALAMPRPRQLLSQELSAPGTSLCCPGISLPRETKICRSAAGWDGSGAAPLGDWLLASVTLRLNLLF